MSYQDYVIKNGKFIGKFNEMYKKYKDPWNLVKNNKNDFQLNYQIIFNLCNEARNRCSKKKITVLEIGCGYPQILEKLKSNGFKVYGIDISETVINKSKKKFPRLRKNIFCSDLLNSKLIKKMNPDIYIMSDVSWYVLPKLKKFLKNIKTLKKNSFLIHSLTMYDKKKQKYGKKFFTNLKEIKKFFNLKFIFSGNIIIDEKKSNYSFFLAKI